MGSPTLQCRAQIVADPLTSRLELDEGDRLTVYDDATGLPIVKGSIVKGNPTIGVGTLLCAPGGITEGESQMLLSNRIAIARRQAGTIDGIDRLNDARQGVLSSTVGSEAWNSRDLKSRPH